MEMNRRQFVILGSAVLCGCNSAIEKPASASDSPVKPEAIDAGPVDQFIADGIYPQFRDRGVFIVRRAGHLTALSSICTHRNCKIDPAADQTFLCKCHGSRFDPQGHVNKGPAKRDLPVYATSVDGSGHLIIQL